MKEEITKHAIEAIKLVADVPKEFREAAFQVVFANLSSQQVQSVKISENTTLHKQKSKNSFNAILKSDFDWTAINIQNLKPTLQNLLILKIIKKEFTLSKLTPNEIQRLLSEKFRLPKTPNAISMSLMNEIGKHVNKTKEGKKFYYEITTNGIAYLDSFMMKLEDSS